MYYANILLVIKLFGVLSILSNVHCILDNMRLTTKTICENKQVHGVRVLFYYTKHYTLAKRRKEMWYAR